MAKDIPILNFQKDDDSESFSAIWRAQDARDFTITLEQMAGNIFELSVHGLKSGKDHNLGTIEASDETDAIRKASEKFAKWKKDAVRQPVGFPNPFQPTDPTKKSLLDFSNQLRKIADKN